MSLYEQLQKLNHSDILPLHMPGHKRSHEIPGMSDIYDIDITEIDGFDDLHHPEGILAQLSEDAAQLYGARQAFLSVGGSSAANLAAVCALCNKNEYLIMDRGCHKSVYYAVELAGLKPIYTRQTFVGKTSISAPVSKKQIEEALDVFKHKCMAEEDNSEEHGFGSDNHSPVVIITSPTYEGLCADVSGIAELVHSYDGYLIVDCAHGGHLGFCDKTPNNPIREGADLVVVSLHKMLPSPTQTGLLLVGNDRIDEDRLQHYMSVFQSSSPSYVLMAGIGECIEYMKKSGAQAISNKCDELTSFRGRLRDRLTNITIEPFDSSFFNHIDKKYEADTNDFTADPFKVVIYSLHKEVSGRDIHRMLLENYHIQCEMYSDRYVLALMSMMDSEVTFSRLEKALIGIDEDISKKKASDVSGISCANNSGDVANTEGKAKAVLSYNEDNYNEENYSEENYSEESINYLNIPQCKCSIQEAMSSDYILKGLDRELDGCVSADYILAYPPGIPVIVPGEIMNLEVINYLLNGLREGLNIIGLVEDDGEIKVRIINKLWEK